MGKKIDLNYDLLYNKYIIEGLSQKATAQFFNVNVDTVVRNLKDYHIPTHKNKDWMENKDKYILSEKQLEIINGALLGDGCLVLHKGAINANFCYASKIPEHVHFVCEEFSDIVMPSHNFSIQKIYDKRTNKEYERCDFRTKANPTFTELYHKWYPEKKKIIPKDLILTPLTVLIWYIGDGSLDSHNNSQTLFLCTDNFKKEDIETILLPQLKEYEPRLIESKKNQYRIAIPRRTIKNFLSYIGDCPVPQYSYKWNYKEYKNVLLKLDIDKEQNDKI